MHIHLKTLNANPETRGEFKVIDGQCYIFPGDWFTRGNWRGSKRKDDYQSKTVINSGLNRRYVQLSALLKLFAIQMYVHGYVYTQTDIFCPRMKIGCI